MRRFRNAAFVGLLFASLLPARPLYAQQNQKVNIYRFVLDADVPESPALVALDVAPTQVLRGSAPKPVAASVLARLGSRDDATSGVALDIAPYFLAGGGIRSLSSYRSNSIEGRLKRVITKTVLSLGAVRDAVEPGSPRISMALRGTFHDPHDPVLNSTLPEQVAEVLARNGVPPIGSAEEDVTDRGVDLAPVFAAARRQMRASHGVQVSGGWGVAGRLRSAAVSRDSLQAVRHTFWLTGQYTLGHRFDLLATLQARNAFRSDTHLRAGTALQRKTTAVDFLGELYYDSADGDLHPGVAVEIHALPRIGVVSSLTTGPAAAEDGGPSRLRMRVLLRWYVAQRQ
jgi:hypothetical protein